MPGLSATTAGFAGRSFSTIWTARFIARYGLLPNTAWIIGGDGRILYKANWTVAADIEAALGDIVDAGARRVRDRLVPMQTERVGWRRNDPRGFRAGLERSGPQAVRDFYGE